MFAIVVIGANRYLSGKKAIEEYNADIIILDDGFQYLNLHRDVNILVQKSPDDINKGRLLPAGYLREPKAAVGRSDIIVFSEDTSNDGFSKKNTNINQIWGKPFFKCKKTLGDKFNTISGAKKELQEIIDSPLGVLTGIADPDRFIKDIADIGIDVSIHFEFPDHHRFSFSDIEWINGISKSLGIEYILTTMKDLVRLKGVVPGNNKTEIIGIPMQLEPERGFFEYVLAGMGGNY
jgi:tetraacyldisaccharide 4'-kinase